MWACAHSKSLSSFRFLHDVTNLSTTFFHVFWGEETLYNKKIFNQIPISRKILNKSLYINLKTKLKLNLNNKWRFLQRFNIEIF